jgi:hypothetical protein
MHLASPSGPLTRKPPPTSCRRVFQQPAKRYVAGANTRGRPEGRPDSWSQQLIHETSGLVNPKKVEAHAVLCIQKTNRWANL